ncbi:carbohydrate esterase family 3 protein [Plenodomus tracheiphilus IPT5]|uniref:Carbohydrate esterase family 3 protein n=1 Tax=Plenodomus tracheiphilus IPT5 TaxID=1408161 RepID=A0A6A7BJM8_9PLEO|nr:carbohydrate esterase family 3 protein [Plenodomus tracheiphilus IPT5]
MVKLNSFALFGLLGLASAAQKTVKIMPFGASIVSKCWRANLQISLRAASVNNFDFVGSQTSSCGGTNIDQNHQGLPGSLATDYAKNGNLVGWLNNANPDVVIMLLGTNDVLIGSKSPTEVLAAYDTLIAQMRTKNPKMFIIFSNLPPLDPARWPAAAVEGIKKLNRAIATYAPRKTTSQSPVYFVDNYSGFNAVTDTVDGEHPNESGNAKLAAKFFQPTRNAIQVVSRSTSVLRRSRKVTGAARRAEAAKLVL